MDLGQYVVTLSGGLDLDVGAELITVFGSETLMSPSKLGGGRYRSDIRSSSQLNIPRTAARVAAPRMRFLTRQVQNHIHEWIGEYRARISDSLLLTGFDDPQLIRYRVGNFFGSHFDVPSPQPRLVSAVALLPSPFAGGEFKMFDHAQTVPLEPGDVCLFPSNFLYPHEVTPVTAGLRYSLVTFLR